MTTLIYSQYNYGLEVEQRDAKIEGKLNIANASNFAISLSPSSPIVIDNLNNTYSITLYIYSQANAAAFKFHGFVCQLE